jgi:DNA-binding MarR family transcriptional regulator
MFHRKKKVSKHHTYGLTALGKTKTEEFAVKGPKFEVLATLNENGPSSVTELAEETHFTPGKVKIALRDLMNDGYVQQVTHDD